MEIIAAAGLVKGRSGWPGIRAEKQKANQALIDLHH